MNERQSLVHGQTGQVVDWYPPEWPNGVPSSAATYAVYENTDDLDGAAEFSGTATADPVATTFDAASGYSQASNRQRCHVAATTDIAVGRFYVAANAFGQRELIKSTLISSGNYVDHEGPLDYDYASSDTFKGLRQYFTIDSTFIADETKIGTDWRILWTYTLGGIQYKRWSYFDVVRVEVEPSATGADLYSQFPDLRHEQYADLRGNDWAHIRERAWKRVRFDLLEFGVTADQFRTEELDEVLLSGMKACLAESGWAPPGWEPQAYDERVRRVYSSDIQKVAGRAAIDKGTSGAATQKGHRKFWFGR